MKKYAGLYVIASIALLIVVATHSEAQMQKMTVDAALATLKPGQWVQLEGLAQRDGWVLCTEMKILTGDFLNDEWGLTAVVQYVDISKQQIRVLGLPMTIHKDTEFDNPRGGFKTIADVKPGMLVDVAGTYLKDGTFLVKEIDDESRKLKDEPDLINEIEAMGKVDSVDLNKQTIVLMGIPFRLGARTKVKSAIR